MSTWATRCNACGTAFRVNADQLEVSEGYVRCGRCDAVFNARSSLFDLDAPLQATAPDAAGQGEPAEMAPPTATGSAGDSPFGEDGRHFSSVPPGSQGVMSVRAPTPDEARPVPAGPQDPKRVHAGAEPADFSEREPEPVWVESNGAPSHSAERSEPVWSATPVAAEAALASDPSSVEEPHDVNARMLELLRAPSAGEPMDSAPPALARPAPLAAEWPSLQRPAKASMSRRGQWLGGVVAFSLAAALPLQWGWIERDALRARWPALHAALNTYWPSLGHAGWQQLEGLTVVSSALKATPQGGAYQLDLVVRNGSSNRLAMPWLDLSLSDAKGKPVLRKALEPSSLGAGAPLVAGEQRRVVAIFKVDGGSVAGYELGLFHP